MYNGYTLWTSARLKYKTGRTSIGPQKVVLQQFCKNIKFNDLVDNPSCLRRQKCKYLSKNATKWNGTNLVDENFGEIVFTRNFCNTFETSEQKIKIINDIVLQPAKKECNNWQRKEKMVFSRNAFNFKWIAFQF